MPRAWEGCTEGVLVMETMSGTESEAEQEGSVDVCGPNWFAFSAYRVSNKDY